MSPEPRPLADRFWAKVARGAEQECWLWTKEVNSSGYGRFEIFEGGRRRRVLAHRFAYQQVTSVSLTRSQVLLHRCDTPRCCNPSHLRCGTQADNMADAKAKGRTSPPPLIQGSRSPNAVLCEGDIPEIRTWIALGYSMASIGRAYGVTYKVISLIRDGKAWSHVPNVGAAA